MNFSFLKTYLPSAINIICPNNVKKNILRYLSNEKILLNAKYYQLDDFFLNTIDVKEIYTYMQEHNCSYENAKLYLEANKLISPVNVLKKDRLIIFIGYNFIPKRYINYLEKNNITYKIININQTLKESVNQQVLCFSYFVEEIVYVCDKIVELLNKSIPLNKIKLYGVNEDYGFMMKQIFSMYLFPFAPLITSPYFHTNQAQVIYRALKDKINTPLSQLVVNDNEVVKILNNYGWFKENINDCIIECIKHDLLKKKVSLINNDEDLEILTDNVSIMEDEYLFILNFSIGNCYVPKKDEDLISDQEKPLYNLETSTEINLINKEILKELIKKENVTITYSKKSNLETYQPNILIAESNLNTVNCQYLYSKYNDSVNKLVLAMFLDETLKYSTIQKYEKELLIKYTSDNYLQYDNNYNNNNINNNINIKQKPLRLSYSAIDEYNQCSFRYYISRVLRIDAFADTFNIFIGNLYHDILSKCFNEDFDFEKEFNNYLLIYQEKINSKEKFLLKKIKEELKEAINIIYNQNEKILYKQALFEKPLEFSFLEDETTVEVNGKIDKILYKEDDSNTNIVLIDYKTSTNSLDLKKIQYGLDLQLVIYCLLVQNSMFFKNPKVKGFYLQHLLHNTTTSGKKEAKYRFDGYTLIDSDSFIENGYEDIIVKGLSKKGDIYLKSAKVLSEDQYLQVIEEGMRQIKIAAKNIINQNFKINPKKIKSDDACKLCNYHDLCYEKGKNSVYYEETIDELDD